MKLKSLKLNTNLQIQSNNMQYLAANLVLGALLRWKNITLSVTRFLPLKCGFWLITVFAQKYQPFWLSVSVLDLNQNSGFGHTLGLCQYSTLEVVQKCMYAHTYAMHISTPS